MTPSPEDRDLELHDRVLDARLRAHFRAIGSTPLPGDVVVAARVRIARHERTIRHRSLLLVAALGIVVVGTATVMSGTLNPNPGPYATTTPSAPATTSLEPTSQASPTSSLFTPPSLTPVPSPTVLAGTWRPMTAAPISGRYGSSGVWTGSEFIVWGGGRGIDSIPDLPDSAIGAAYDPATDRWRRIAPSPLGHRDHHFAVWTGQEMLVWGGNDDPQTHRPTATIAGYDPTTDTWRRITDAPFAGYAPVAGYPAVWTGRELIVRGATGGLAAFDPRVNQWRTLPDPSTAEGWVQYMVWTGTELLVFVAPDGVDSAVLGYRLDPETGASRPVAASSWWALYAAPPIWAGDQVISISQYPERSRSGLSNSVAYDPATDRWRAIGSCPAGIGHAVWTGTYIMGSHSAYDVARDTCFRLPTPPVRPDTSTTGREVSAFTWTGREYLIWSGGDGSDRLVPTADGLIFTLGD